MKNLSLFGDISSDGSTLVERTFRSGLVVLALGLFLLIPGKDRVVWIYPTGRTR
jgi:hypothetical protein